MKGHKLGEGGGGDPAGDCGQQTSPALMQSYTCRSNLFGVSNSPHRLKRKGLRILETRANVDICVEVTSEL